MFRKPLELYRSSSFCRYLLEHKVVFEIILGALFGGAMLSIPLCSFRTNLFVITWVITIPLLLAAIIYTLAHPIKIGIVSLALMAFPLCALLSSALNGFQGFVFTPILMALVTFVLFGLNKASGSLAKILVFAAFAAALLFGFVYFFSFWREILSLNFTRLGSMFGDINDIAICLSVGLVLSFGYFVKRKRFIIKIGAALCFFFFALLGASTGSKIFYFIALVTVVLGIFLHFGKRRLWLSFGLVFGVIVVGIVVLSLPFLATVRERLWLFLVTLFNPSSSSTTDYGTVFRVDMINSALNLWLRKPLFGFGVFGYSVKSGLNMGWSHNHFSEILCNYGLVGFVAFHIPFVFALKGKRRLSEETSFLCVLLVVLFIVCMLSVSLDTEKVFAYMVGVPYGCLCSDAKPKNSLEVLKSRRKAVLEDWTYEIRI